MRLLLIEDDRLLGDAISTGFKQESYSVNWLRDGLLAKSVLRTDTFDAIILDLGLPSLSGLELLKQARSMGIQTPVLILTAKDDLPSRIAGLDSGADDYLTKPFEFDELSARLRACLRRAVGRSSPKIIYGEISLNPASHEVTYQGQPIKVSRREFAILNMLLNQIGRVIPRSHFLDALYSWDEEIDSNALEVHIHHLRKKFYNELILTVRGVGYLIPEHTHSHV